MRGFWSGEKSLLFNFFNLFDFKYFKLYIRYNMIVKTKLESEMKDIFWAKKNTKDGIIKWLPLRRHLLDVAFIIDRLWEAWLDEGQRKIIQKSLREGDINPKKLIRFIALTHDICKQTYSFQTGYNKRFATVEDDFLERLEINGLKVISLKTLLPNPEETPHAKAGQSLLLFYGVNEDIATIVGSHHGKPVGEYDEIRRLVKAYKRNFFQSDKEDEISNLWKKEQRDLFEWALFESGYEDVNELPRINQQGQMILSGLLIMADWIASNEDYFPLIDFDQECVDDEVSRCQDAWLKWKKSDSWTAVRSSFEDVYKDRFDHDKPKDAQKDFLDIVDSVEEPGIFIFEAPMGMGKTEAALVAVEQLANKCGKSGMFFGLPTQATSNGIFNRINEWLESVAQENVDTYSIRLSHGKAQLNDDFNLIKNKKSRATSVNLDSGYDGNLLVNEWFSGRKTTSLDDFVVGTIDQFLMIALKQKHLALRHLGFSKKVIVIDEVHAYDLYMSQYLNMAIRWAAAYNLPVIILSATLPSKKRIELIESYLLGKGLRGKDIIRDSVDLYTDSYPLITYSDGNSIKQFNGFRKSEDKKVHIIRIDYDEIISLIEGMSKSKGVIGIIVNTVRKAQELAKVLVEIYGEDKIDLLHSSFIATDRAKKEKDLLNIIGKDKDRPDFKIIIGTQVIEQSLDIDFDLLVSELCPMDLLLQRIGRLHRHDRIKPDMHKKARLYVFGTNEELIFEEGSQYVYGGYILARTQHYLPEVINIPSDISRLVQKVYSDDLINTSKHKDTYTHYKEEYDLNNQKKKDRAKTYRLKKPNHTKRGTIKGLLDEISGVSWEKNEEQGQNQVRDIHETIEVIALKSIGRGYGFFEGEEDISKKSLDYDLEKEISKHTLRLPLALSMNNIDDTIKELEQFTNKRLFEWQNSTWLKGALGIIFDENNEFVLNGCILKYDNKYGLSYERRTNGEI